MSCTSQQACEAGGRIIAPGVSPGIRIPILPKPAKQAADDMRNPRYGVKHKSRIRRSFGAHHHFHAAYPGLTPGATLCRALRGLVVAFVLTTFFGQMTVVNAQTPPSSPSARDASIQNPVSSRYLDQTNGMSADDAVTHAIANNGELAAARKEIDAARAMVKQARLRANPKLDIEGARQIPPGKDNSVMASAMLPLELGGRRATRITVAKREVINKALI